MKSLVEQIAKRFSDHPDDVAVSQLSGRRTVILELRCNSRDIGRVIGRSGRTVGAIRVLLNALAAKDKRRVILEVVGEQGRG